jgi:hypothetical protein
MMKKRTLSALCGGLSLALLLTACGGNGSTSAGNDAENSSNPTQSDAAASATTEYQWDFQKKNAAIDDLKTPCDQQGTVVSLEYDTPAYAVNDLLGADETLHKTMKIYLPYGYDESQQYNVLYLLHGTTGENDGPMEGFWLEQWGDYTLPVLDNMIAQGLCDPVIVVCPNYYSPVEGYTLTDEDAKALSEKLNDSYIWSETAEDGGEVDNVQNIWPVYFGQELRNNIIPAVEAAYSTYAGGDVSEESLIASRDHRAFAGLSRGSMTVVRAGLMSNADLFAYYGDFSGIWAEFDQFKAALEGDFKDYDIKFWYNGNGKGDFALENHQAFKEQVLSEMSDRFVDGENYAWVVIKDGAHMYNSWVVDLYNSLLVFFQ